MYYTHKMTFLNTDSASVIGTYLILGELASKHAQITEDRLHFFNIICLLNDEHQVWVHLQHEANFDDLVSGMLTEDDERLNNPTLKGHDRMWTTHSDFANPSR